jgi:SAM-dependent methyltransferase
MPDDGFYYRSDLALVHHLGFGFHARLCTPGILELLQPVLERGGLVVELGCGSGLLTKPLVAAGHRVIATDASPAMLEIAERYAPGTEDLRRLVLPDDPIPEADAVVSVGHVLSYLPDAAAIDRALVASAEALRPGGVFALDLCDLEQNRARAGAGAGGSNYSAVNDHWALITRFEIPAPDRFVREMTTFIRDDDGSWHRDDERHENVLVDTAQVPALLAEHGVDAFVGRSFGDPIHELMPGVNAIVGHRRSEA